MASINELKRTLVEASAICEMEGLSEAFGHISARIPDTDQILMTPGAHPGGAKLSEILTLDLKGNVIRGHGKPNIELPIHTSVYRLREDVGSVVHVHPLRAVAFSLAGEEIRPMSFADKQFSPSVPIFGKPGAEVFIDSDELGEKMAHALGTGVAVVIRGHGAVTVGESIEAACMTAVSLERTAELQFMASVLLLAAGPAAKGFQIPRLAEVKGEMKTFIDRRQFNFYRTKLRKYLKE
jgi:ribulose-5-phosphate 4-epimerase/fuculose-1-phosphate aldolase